MAIARYATKLGANVTMLLGPVSGSRVQGSGFRIKIKRFKYFDELKKLVKNELTRGKYDILVHAAAVADYMPVRTASKKIKSGQKTLVIKLRPTVKIADQMRRQAKDALLVMFKLESDKFGRELVDTAYKSLLRAKADMIVANNTNEIGRERHRAYIIDKNKRVVGVRTKKELAAKLFKSVSEKIDKGK
jgi:phosphopantothenoylcysteine synthetase/decarboxylase